jgi:hypothetical protein
MESIVKWTALNQALLSIPVIPLSATSVSIRVLSSICVTSCTVPYAAFSGSVPSLVCNVSNVSCSVSIFECSHVLFCDKHRSLGRVNTREDEDHEVYGR